MSEEKPKYGTVVEEKTEHKVKKPPMFKVFLLNDDYTTMEFVVEVLTHVFHKNRTEATQIMLHVHKRGVGLCGVYSREIAETKVEQVHTLAKEHEFPLRCTIERE
ncbi:MAG: ATP-dependent Clp protease adapter ClpS [Nitrospirota bacterium]|nr:MAG: ATP-dependent Clp protease adapter ClpS [Nitrospirota bacterium]